MILPIGHEETATRRWPWVTFGLIAACVLAFLVTDASLPAPPAPEEALGEAAAYWREHAYLEAAPELEQDVAYDVLPNQRSQYLALLKDQGLAAMPDDPEVVAAEQAELDRLTERALAGPAAEERASTDHPYWRWGVVPGSATAVTLLSHQFLHGGWLHLLGNLFLLLLIAPAIEDRWGRPLFLAFYLSAGVAGALVHLALHDEALPMIGASGAISGVLGAFAVRFAKTRMRFLYVFFIGFRLLRGTFEAPAWAMLGVWFGNEIVQAWWASSSGLAGGVAYGAHVGGFVFGAATAFAMARFAVEQRWLEPTLESKVTLARGNAAVQQALQAREGGDLDTAYALLEAEARRAPQDPDVQLAFWDAAADAGRAAEAAPGLARLARGLAAKGELAQAARVWSELTNVLPDALADPATLLKLFPVLREGGDAARAVLALRHAVDPRATGVSAGIALRVAELARPLDPPTALRAARRALAFAEIDASKRERVQAVVAELEAQGVREPEDAAPAAPAQTPPPAAEAPGRRAPIEIELEPDDEHSGPEIERGAPGPPPETGSPDTGESRAETPVATSSLAALAAWPAVKVSEAVPVGLRDDGLALRTASERQVVLAWPKVQALSVVAVRDLGPKPVVLVDLVLNWQDLAGEGPLKVVRLRSDRFDARALAEGASPADSLRAFLELVLERSGAVPLPDPDGARGRPFRVYDAVARYQREVLQVAE